MTRKWSGNGSEEIRRVVERKKRNVSWYGGEQKGRKIWRNIGE